MTLTKRFSILLFLSSLFINQVTASSICGTDINCRDFFIQNPEASSIIKNFVNLSSSDITSGSLGDMLSGGDDQIGNGTLVIFPAGTSSAYLEKTFNIFSSNMAFYLPNSTPEQTLTFRPANDADISQFTAVGSGARALITLADGVENIFF